MYKADSVLLELHYSERFRGHLYSNRHDSWTNMASAVFADRLCRSRWPKNAGANMLWAPLGSPDGGASVPSTAHKFLRVACRELAEVSRGTAICTDSLKSAPESTETVSMLLPASPNPRVGSTPGNRTSTAPATGQWEAKLIQSGITLRTGVLHACAVFRPRPPHVLVAIARRSTTTSAAYDVSLASRYH